MPWNDDDITPAALLTHIQAMRGDLTTRIDRLEKHLDRFESHATLQFAKIQDSLGNLDARLDAIELEFLPKRMTALEKRVGTR